MNARYLSNIVLGSALSLVMLAATAQSRPPTPEQIGKDPNALRQEAEQQRARELQRQQQQQKSQQESDQLYNDAVRQQQSRAANDMAQAEAVRRSWQQRPPLAADKNPLLGRWQSLGAAQRTGGAPGVSPDMANLANALLGNITSGMCDGMLGRGTIEFRPTGVVAIGNDGRERPMYGAEYRGGGSRVVVLPTGGTSFTHMIIDFDRPDHATVAAVGCVLSKAGATAAKTSANTAVAASPAATPQTVARAAPASASAAGSAAASSAAPAGGGVLTVVVGALSPTDKVAGRKMWVLKTDPQFALIKAGITSTPYASVLQNWIRACDKKEQSCFAGLQALQPHSVGFLATDANGQARTPPLPAGRYWVLCDTKVDNKRVAWDQPVDVKASGATLTFDRSNVIAVD